MATATPDVMRVLLDGQGDFLKFLERRVSSRAVAEDLLQDALVRSIERAGDLRDEEAVVAWFYRMLRNAVVDHYRRGGVSQKALEGIAKELEDEAEPSPDTKDAICQCVKQLAANLKPEYAAAIQRIEVEGVSVKQFAEEAGITPNNAAVRVFRAREALTKQVRASCGACAEHGCVDCGCHKKKDVAPRA